MNKVYQYISDHRLPTEYPFKTAVWLYGQRFLIIGAVVLSAMIASILLALIILTFQAGYGYIVIIAVILIFLGGRGTSGGGQSPPPSYTPKTQSQPEERQATTATAEKVLVAVPISNPQKQKMLAQSIDEPAKPPKLMEIYFDKDR